MAATTSLKASSPKQVEGTTNEVNTSAAAAVATITATGNSIAAAKVVVADGETTTTPPTQVSPITHPDIKTADTTAEEATPTTAAAADEAVEDSAGAAFEDGSAATVAASVAPPETTVSDSEPTYESIEQSETYQTALALMKTGDFAEALETLEQGIEELTESLGPERAEFHESLAPFQYLYGSTLLYKIEEEDPKNGVGGMMMMNPRQESEGGNSAGNEEDEEEDVEDLQIAYENLDSARALVEKMIKKRPSDKLKADLAQIYLREGDLNRLNGNNEAAVKDYEDSLRHLQNNTRVGKFDRKIADLHYNLGLTYTLQAAEAAAAAASPDSTNLPQQDASLPPPRETSFYRSRGMHHFWQCSKTLAGHMAFLCGVENPQQLLDKAECEIANLKCTGEEADEHSQQEHPAIVSRKLSKLREELTKCLPQSTHSEHQDLVQELSRLLEDIHETIDEAERSEQGLQQVTEMKAEISAAVAAAAMAEEQQGDNKDKASSSWGFEPAAAAANTDAAQPIQVKKKKKRDAEEANLGGDTQRAMDAKRRAAE